MFWLSIPSGFLVVFEQPNQSSFSFTTRTWCGSPVGMRLATPCPRPMGSVGGSRWGQPAGAAAAGTPATVAVLARVAAFVVAPIAGVEAGGERVHTHSLRQDAGKEMTGSVGHWESGLGLGQRDPVQMAHPVLSQCSAHQRGCWPPGCCYRICVQRGSDDGEGRGAIDRGRTPRPTPGPATHVPMTRRACRACGRGRGA